MVFIHASKRLCKQNRKSEGETRIFVEQTIIFRVENHNYRHTQKTRRNEEQNATLKCLINITESDLYWMPVCVNNHNSFDYFEHESINQVKATHNATNMKKNQMKCGSKFLSFEAPSPLRNGFYFNATDINMIED